jgi:hypothetical protein
LGPKTCIRPAQTAQEDPTAGNRKAGRSWEGDLRGRPA